jgi:hypothetical protein
VRGRDGAPCHPLVSAIISHGKRRRVEAVRSPSAPGADLGMTVPRLHASGVRKQEHTNDTPRTTRRYSDEPGATGAVEAA